MKHESRKKDVWKGARGPGLREGLLIRLEVIGFGLVAVILASFSYTLLGWFGASEKVAMALSFVFGVTLFWMFAIFSVWAGIEGENRRQAALEKEAARQKAREGSPT